MLRRSYTYVVCTLKEIKRSLLASTRAGICSAVEEKLNENCEIAQLYIV
jgi:hypothetical protein